MTLLALLERGIVPDYIVFNYVPGNMIHDIKHRVYKVIRAVDHYFPGIMKRFHILDGWVEEAGTKYDFIAYMERARFPLPRVRLWCNDKMKIKAMIKFLEQRGVKQFVNVLGLRREERTRSNYMSKLQVVDNVGGIPVYYGQLAKSAYGGMVRYFMFPIWDWSSEQIWSHLKEHYPEVLDALHDMYLNVGGRTLNLSLCVICPLHNREMWHAIVKSELFDVEYILNVLYWALEREHTKMGKRIIQYHIKCIEEAIH